MARLFFTAPSGAEGTQLQVHTDGQGSVRQEASAITAEDLPPGATLPDGTFEGQLLRWNGTAWVPAEPGDLGVIDGLRGLDASLSELQLAASALNLVGERVQAQDNLGNSVVGVSNIFEFYASTTNEIGLCSILGSPNTLDLDVSTIGVQGSKYQMLPGGHYLRTPDAGGTPANNLRLESDINGEPTMGCLGAAPVVRQTIADTSTVAALASVVSALAALGLANAASVTPAAVRVIGHTGGAAVIPVLAAGHAAGYYTLKLTLLVRTIAAGSVVPTWQLSTPTTGAVNIALAAATLGVLGISEAGCKVVTAYSNGVNAINLSLAAVGSGVLDVTAQAVLTGT